MGAAIVGEGYDGSVVVLDVDVGLGLATVGLLRVVRARGGAAGGLRGCATFALPAAVRSRRPTAPRWSVARVSVASVSSQSLLQLSASLWLAQARGRGADPGFRAVLGG
jgi:hypothetical protein